MSDAWLTVVFDGSEWREISDSAEAPDAPWLAHMPIAQREYLRCRDEFAGLVPLKPSAKRKADAEKAKDEEARELMRRHEREDTDERLAKSLRKVFG